MRWKRSNDIRLIEFVGVASSSLLAAAGSSAHQRDAPISSSSSSKRTKKSSKKKKGRRKTTSDRGPISPQDLADHVSTMYIHGPGGKLRETEDRRHRRQNEMHQQQSLAFASTTTAPGTKMTIDWKQQEEQLASIRKLDRHPALLLNADYQPMSWLPLSLWNWQEAVKAVFSGKVIVVDVYPEIFISAANIEVPLPSVIALTDYVPQFNQVPAFTKRNVFLRDEYRCQYCGNIFHTRDLSLDHVVPRCKGGPLNWENAVTCCRKCNGRKGSLDLSEIKSIGMQLLRPPRTPTQYELAKTASRMLPRKVHPTWEPYLGIQYAKSKSTPSASSPMQPIGSSRQAGGLALEEEIE